MSDIVPDEVQIILAFIAFGAGMFFGKRIENSWGGLCAASAVASYILCLLVYSYVALRHGAAVAFDVRWSEDPDMGRDGQRFRDLISIPAYLIMHCGFFAITFLLVPSTPLQRLGWASAASVFFPRVVSWIYLRLRYGEKIANIATQL